MINFQDSLNLVVNSPLDPKLCNYYRENSYFKIEPIAKYLERIELIYRTPGIPVVMLIPVAGYIPPYDINGLISYDLINFDSFLGSFTVRYYHFLYGIENENFTEISYSYTYIGYASDNQGADFSLTSEEGLNYIAILVTTYEIPTPTVNDFSGLWFSPTQVNVDWNSTDLNDPRTILNKPNVVAQVQANWTETNQLSKAYIWNKPNIQGVSPGLPINAIQFNNNNNFGGSEYFIYATSEDKIYLLANNTSTSGIKFSSLLQGPEIWANDTGELFSVVNKTDSTSTFLIDSGRVAIGDINIEGQTFFQIKDDNNVPHLYTFRVRNNISEDLLVLKEDGNLFIPKIPSESASTVLNYDPLTGKITYYTRSSPGQINLKLDNILKEENIVELNLITGDNIGFSYEYPGKVLVTATADPQVNSDWNATDGVAQILNKPSLPQSENSVQGDGTTLNKIKLSGDSPNPGLGKYYGTGISSTVRGFYDLPTLSDIAFTDLSDVIPENYISKKNHVPIITEDELHVDLIPTEELETIIAEFTLLADCPQTYAGFENYTLTVKNSADGLEFTLNSAIIRGQYRYDAQSNTADTVGDWRTYSDDNGYYTQYCSVGNATKGAGTWITKQTIIV